MKRLSLLLSAFLALVPMLSASSSKPGVTVSEFGRMPDQRVVQLYTVTNANGLKMDVTNYGAIIVRLYVPDRDGKLDDIVLGFDEFSGYTPDSPYLGAVVGRYGNRIADGKFTLDGKTYTLAKNNTPNGVPVHLHGGEVGFDKVLWNAEPVSKDGIHGVKLSYTAKDGEEGYPGNVTVTVHYWLTNENELKITYAATTDKATPLNVTQHTYFNLSGAGVGTILDHEVTLDASHFTPTDKGLIPTGEIAPVEGTPFDFRKPHKIGARIDADHEQLKLGGGYDHNWVLDKKKPGELSRAAVVYEAKTGRQIEVFTTEPGIQFYAGNFLDGTIKGKQGRTYLYRGGLCLETQHFPDSPNQPNFPSTILRPGKTYESTTIYRFSTR
ncbi:MAG: galactose mutarotase [Opitutus sp.]|nr:galactose mutarotase [Opitutus sp.]